MAYSLNKKYHFISYAGSGKYLNVYGNETVTNNSNVCVWTKTVGANSQGWEIRNFTAGLKIVTSLNPAYALDFWRGTSNYANCDMYLESGNDTDSVITLTAVDSVNNIYKIKLANQNLYLTAKGTSDNSDVRWEAPVSSGTTQQWKLVEWPVATSKTIAGMYSIYNKFYSATDSWIKTYGCAVCSACNINSFYARIGYTISQAKADGMYNEVDGVLWGNVKYANCTLNTQSTQAAYLSKIVEQINLNKPVLVHCIGGGNEHWVVAYGYTNGGTTTSDILVLDSVNTDTSQLYGVERTLYQAMDISYDVYTIKELRLTSAK